jgi:hypothetical protein
MGVEPPDLPAVPSRGAIRRRSGRRARHHLNKTKIYNSIASVVIGVMPFYVLVSNGVVMGLYTSMVDAVQRGKDTDADRWVVFAARPNADGAAVAQQAR